MFHHRAMRRRNRCLVRAVNSCVSRIESLESRVLFAGTWTTLVNAAPGAVGTMELLPNGNVFTTTDGDGAGTDYAILTPSASGSYVNGTWTRAARSHDTRLFDSTDVLQNGNVFVAGGEYGTGLATGEIYNPLNNAWTELPAQTYGNFADSWSQVIANGDVLITPVGPNPGGYTTLFNPTTNAWSQGPQLANGEGSADEQSWAKLADGSILTVGGTSSQRYIPAQNKFVSDASVPVTLSDSLGEYGPAFLLSSGKALFVGASGQSAIYTPSGTTSPGSWVAGPTIPGGLGEDDASGVSLRDGTILVTAGPIDSYNGPTSLFLYTPGTGTSTGTFTSAAGPITYGGAAFLTRMLALPNGDVLYSENGTTLYQYDPGTTALAASVPTISSVTPNGNGTVTLTGTNLNGINTGAEYGDDAQMDTNYPLVELTAGSNVYYATSYNWSSTGVMLGSTSETVNFTLPRALPAGTYSLAAVANGVASATTTLTVSTTSPNAAPTISTAAAVTPASLTTTTAALSVLGADDNGESNISYTWVDTGTPSGAPLASFSINGTNASKNTTVSFHAIGTYTFLVTATDSGGLFVNSSSVSVTVSQGLTSVTLTPNPVNISAGQTQQLTATGEDQFGNPMASQPAFTWSITSGGGSVSQAGIYTAPATGTSAAVKAATGSLSASTTVAVVNIPWTSADVGTVGIPGTAYDSGTTTTVTVASDDIWVESDDMHFDYQELAVPATGTLTVIARINSESSASGYVKAGVMIRNSLNADDVMGMECDPAGNGPLFEWRTSTTTNAAQDATSGASPPEWVQLQLSGGTVTGYSSTNGTTWTSTGSQALSFGTNVYVGLALSSHNAADLATAVFSNVSVVANQTLTSVKVLSTPENLTVGQSQQLIAEGIDQNGFLMSTQPAFTWTLASGTGTLTSTGLYTATAGTLATVNAGTGALTAAGTVAVVNSPWTSTDIGAVSAPGTAYDTSTSTTTITDTSDDIWNESDDFHFDYQTITGNGSITAELNSQTTTGGNFTKAGLMIRNSLNPDDTMAMVFDAANGTPFEWRTAAGTNATQGTNNTNYGTPYWYRLVRAGNVITGYSSPNGTTWTQLGTITLSMNATVYIGLALTSHSTTTGATAVFSNVSISNPTVATAAAVSPSPVTAKTATLSVLGANTPNSAGESSLKYTWAATAIPSGAPTPTFSVNGTNASKNTSVTFGAIGSYTFTVTITDTAGNTTTSVVTAVVNQTLTTIVVTPATVGVNENATQAFTAVGYDQFGNAVSVQPTFSWAVTAGAGQVSSGGVYTAPSTTGAATVQASSGSIVATASVTVTSTSPTINSVTATPSTVSGNSSSLSVSATDAGGASNLTYTWAESAGPGGAPLPTISPNGTNSANSSSVTFYQAGNYTLTVTVKNASALSSTGTVAITVVQTLSAIVVTPSSAGLNENASQTFTAVADDQFGKPLSSQPVFSWTKLSGIGSINSASGVYTAPASAGSATIEAVSGSAVGLASITVTNSAPTVATPAAASPSTVTANTSSLSVLGSDDGGQPNLTYTWAKTAGPAGAPVPTYSLNGTNAAQNTTVTFYQAGGYTLTATITDSGGLNTTSSVNVTVSQTLHSIAVTPSNANLSEGAVQNFSATAYDQFGLALSSQPVFTWTKTAGIGTVNSGTGQYTAPASAGSATIQAASGSVVGTASITVTNSAPTVATPAAATPSTVTSTTASLSVLGADDGGQSNLTYTWSETAGPAGAPAPTYGINGTNAAQNTTVTFYQAGGYTLTATITDSGGLTTTSSVVVTVNQSLTAVTFPANTVVAGGTDQAGTLDQFGNPFVPAVTYSDTGGGIITSTGLFTANQSGGATTITASAGGSSATTGLIVVPTVYTGAAGADTYSVRLSPANPSLLQIFVNTPETGSPAYTIAANQIPSLAFDPAGSDGSVTVDFANGNPVPAGGIGDNGGSGLVIDGSPTGGLEFVVDASHVTTGSMSTIAYSNLQTIAFDLTGGSNTLTQLAQPTATVTYNAGAGNNTLNVDGGSYSFAADPNATDGNLTVNDNAAVTFAPTPGTGITPRHLAALNLGPGDTATVQTPDAPADRQVLVVGGLSIGSGAALDLTANDMIVQGGNLAAIDTGVATGYSNGSWTGTGITSSVAANDLSRLTALGTIRNAAGAAPIYPTFDGQPSTTADVLVKYTWFGDANLDGTVDGSDYSLIDAGSGSPAATGWVDGDFNYDGTIDGSDYSLIDNTFNNQTAALPAARAQVTAEIAVSATITPAVLEPIGRQTSAKPLPMSARPLPTAARPLPTAFFQVQGKADTIVTSAVKSGSASSVAPPTIVADSVVAKPAISSPFYTGLRKARHANSAVAPDQWLNESFDFK